MGWEWLVFPVAYGAGMVFLMLVGDFYAWRERRAKDKESGRPRSAQ